MCRIRSAAERSEKHMNVTELARILKVTPNDLKEKLPRMGFDIGFRAIKIDPKTAQMIFRDWPFLLRKLQAEDENKVKAEREEMIAEGMVKQVIPIPSVLTVRDFAALTHLPVNKVLAELMKNGVFASMNERIDSDTAFQVASMSKPIASTAPCGS